MALALSLIVGIAITIAVFGFIWIGSPDSGQRIARRLEESTPPRETYERSSSASLIRDEELSALPWLDRALGGWSKIDALRMLLSQAGIETKPGQILLTTGVVAMLAYLIAYSFFGRAWMGGVSALVIGSVPIVTIVLRRRARLRSFEKNFPDAIDLLARAVRAGHALSNGIEIVGQEMTEPLAGEFRKTFEEQRLGLEFREALVNLTKRVPLQDVRFFAAALTIQDETGGNLAEILANLAATVRERFKIRGDVQVKTAQGRLTAVILTSLPPAMLIVLNFMNPGYSRVLFTDPYGITALSVAAGLQVVGAFILWRIVNIDV
ncbi:MAG TPA: type II secretion system F family protein [Candidatus Sulfotelmatobacter sp.]|nr:type II secretion system F family protein [Candidatus Sulfotelmatobacter sp.]